MVVVVSKQNALWRFTRAAIILGVLAPPPVLAAATQPGFPSADEAVTALVQAIQKHDVAAVGTVLGPGSEALVRSGDPVKDREEGQKFLDAYAAHHDLMPDGPDWMTLRVGTNDRPVPVPIVRQNGTWHFDSHAGAQEIVDRGIGRNELATIRFCLAYVDAQNDYFEMFKRATGTGVYAQHLVSTPGNYDGLYWPSAPNTPDSPLAALVASAIEEGYPDDVQAGKRVPYQGYYFRVLKAQGPNSPGGSKNYVQGGKMVDGFALVAWPVTYGASGIMTFIVDRDGVVFQKDLGPRTTASAAKIEAFDPNLDWAPVDVAGQ